MGRALETKMHNENSSVLHEELHLQNPNTKLKEALVGQGRVVCTLKSLFRKPSPVQNTV